MVKNNSSVLVGSVPTVDLTTDDCEQDPLLTSTYIYRRHPLSRAIIGPSHLPYNRPHAAGTQATQSAKRPFSTVSTIQLSKKPDGTTPLTTYRPGPRPDAPVPYDEFIDITDLASKLCVDVQTSQYTYLRGQQGSSLDIRCVGCVRRRVTRAALPCCHLCLCMDCGDQLLAGKKTCPVCTSHVTNVAAFSLQQVPMWFKK